MHSITVTAEIPPELTKRLESIEARQEQILSILTSKDHFDPDEWLTGEQIREQFKIAPATLTRRVRAGDIEKRSLGGRVVRYRAVLK